MIRFLMIADDFTGALDSGVQFAARGARTRVVTDPAYDFSQAEEDLQVLVLDAETRHLTPEAAYGVVFRAVEGALKNGFTYIYKKTDSALRGNVGAELTAVLDAAGADSLAFLPALPGMDRVTRKGIHYIDGVPVAESVFGQDPFEPVTASSVTEIIGAQSKTPVVLHETGAPGEEPPRPGIQVYDAETDGDLLRIGRALGKEGLRLSAGCAGVASVLAELLELEGTPPERPYLVPSLFVACGSVNQVTLRQMETAEAAGFAHVHLTPKQKLETSWLETEDCAAAAAAWLGDAGEKKRFILDVNDPAGRTDTADYAKERGLTAEDLRVRISGQLGQLVRRLLDGGLDATLLCTGGDTLLALMRAVGVAELAPVCDLDAGAVLTDFVYAGKAYHIISKSGGFGEPDLFIRLAKSIGAGDHEEEAVC
ncbi:four-carbon acid sugar kinase family protein [Oscillibacter sp. CU971]|uniref:four-carbon acid sugar kinase family protein n=1 Tax=Oscillibacter sp. CU971 TaxID=2780102 RepID=UPI00195A8298|nr:four-carbon acid sugar kinase family protein [Oscillibacter sp. CU971]